MFKVFFIRRVPILIGPHLEREKMKDSRTGIYSRLRAYLHDLINEGSEGLNPEEAVSMRRLNALLLIVGNNLVIVAIGLCGVIILDQGQWHPVLFAGIPGISALLLRKMIVKNPERWVWQISINILTALGMGAIFFYSFNLFGDIDRFPYMTPVLCPATFFILAIPPYAAYILGKRYVIAWTVISIITLSLLLIKTMSLNLGHEDMVLNILIFGCQVILVLIITWVGAASRGLADNHIEILNAQKALIDKQKEELLEAHDRALSASRSKSTFLANMSHEIRTPMNAIIGMTGLLLDSKLTADQEESANIVRNAGNTLLGIINDILDFSKIEAGKIEFELIGFNLRSCVEDIGDMLAVKAHDKGLELPVLFHSDVPTEVKGDPGRLRQVLINLVNNAIKFTKAGEVMIRVRLCDLTEAHTRIAFDIVDTGIGIPADHQANLFEAFSQMDASTTRKYGGTGLGLAISKQLIEIMGGEIKVKSIEGKGSTFSFTVKLDRCQSDQESSVTIQPMEISGLRVLIVDSNVTNRKVFHEQLKTWKCYAEEASHAMQALEMIRAAAVTKQAFQLALIDFRTADLDGEKLARKIKGDPLISHIPLINVISVPQRGDAIKMLEAGFDAYLTKPVKQSQLYDAIATVLGGPQKSEQTTPKVLVPQYSLTEAARFRLKILVVDDNVVNQKVAARMLENEGFRSDVAANGREAIEALSRIRYDIVFMDCQMPVMDGYEATAAIRKIEGKNDQASTPIIAMTAHAMKGDRERCLEAGMDDYVSKPVSIEALKKILHKYSAGKPSLEIVPKTETKKAEGI